MYVLFNIIIPFIIFTCLIYTGITFIQIELRFI